MEITMKAKVITLVISILFLFGCASSSSGVIGSNQNEFTIVYTGSTGAANTGTMKTKAYKEASEYCVAKNQQLNLISTDIPPGPYVWGNFPQVEVTFTCVPKTQI